MSERVNEKETEQNICNYNFKQLDRQLNERLYRWDNIFNQTTLIIQL